MPLWQNYCPIIFSKCTSLPSSVIPSKTILNFDEVNENHQKIIFWDGKKESDVVEYENIVNGTEFFSEALNQNGTSSYIENYNKTKDSIFELMAWKPNENSNKLSDKYIKNTIEQQIIIIYNNK